MASIDSKQSYFNTKSAEERRAFVDAEIAKGNPKYMNRDQWLTKNAVPIAIRSLEQKVDALTEIVKKFSKSK